MGYKMKQDESPVTYTLPPGSLGYKSGTFTSGASGASGAGGAAGAAGAAGGGMPGLGMAAGAVGGIVDQFTPKDPHAKGFKGATIASNALEYGAMGSQFGPWGAAIGAVGGGIYGAFKADELAAEATKQKKEFNIQTGMGDANAQYMENVYGKGEDLGDTEPIAVSKKGKIKTTEMNTSKSLAAMTGTVAHNMPVSQYNSAVKMSGIAMKLADKDYDGDSKIESSEEEYLGSIDNKIKENKNK